MSVVDDSLSWFVSTPASEDPVTLAGSLWDLAEWSHQGAALADLLAATTDPASRLAVAAQLVRHLRTDPLLPDDLLPRGWPGAVLRSTYADYQAELREITVNAAGG